MVLTPPECYAILGLATDTPRDEVKRAYRRIAKRLHPDVTGTDSRRFSEITAAYSVLMGRVAGARCTATETDFDRDAAYAEFVRRASHVRAPKPAPHAPRPQGTQGTQAAATESATTEVPPAAAQTQTFGSTPVEVQVVPELTPRPSLWQRLLNRLRPGVSVAGSDVVQSLHVGLTALLRGVEQTLIVTRASACPCCPRGGELTCVCGGAGRIIVRERLKVVVPAGARAGSKMRLTGKGNDGLLGRPAGDLYLILEPETVPGYRREGANLRGALELPASIARSGGTIAVATPWGRVRLDVPAGTREGARFRLREQGLPRWRQAGRGELFLKVAVH